MTFKIFYQSNLIFAVTVSSEATVHELLAATQSKLNHRFDNFIGLAAVNGDDVLNFSLGIPSYRVKHYRQNEEFELLLGQKVADQRWPTLKDFAFLRCVGEGISAHVYLVRHLPSAKLFALKQIKKEYITDFKRLEQILRERNLMVEDLKDVPFMTKLFASFESQHHLNLLLEYYPGGEFFYHLQQRKLSEVEAKLCFAEVLLTFEELHSRSILYRDLKPENIMIDLDGHLRVGDFGLCKTNVNRTELSFSCCGSPEYMPPETKLSTGYSFSADFYTMGALIYEMVRGVPPYYENMPLDFPEGLSAEFEELVRRLVEQDPRRRLSDFGELKRMDWLKHIDWAAITQKRVPMPLQVTPYVNYIHEEFRSKRVDNEALTTELKYDRLLNIFEYLSPDSAGISEYYCASSVEAKSRITSMVASTPQVRSQLRES